MMYMYSLVHICHGLLFCLEYLKCVPLVSHGWLVGVVSFINGGPWLLAGSIVWCVCMLSPDGGKYIKHEKICDCLNRSSISREGGTFLFLITIITFFVCK